RSKSDWSSDVCSSDLFAGSIGIIGIALILSLSNGVNDYIQSVEEETLSEYPLQILSTGLDLSSMGEDGSGGADSSGQTEEKAGRSGERRVGTGRRDVG